MYFYELHEGDEDLFSDVLLASDELWASDDFFDVVQTIRRRIQDRYREDTLIEAIAVELERDHGFVFVSDDRLQAAVNVSTVEEDNFLAEIGEETEAGYRSLFVEYAGEDERND